jgi:hypothetical protein
MTRLTDRLLPILFLAALLFPDAAMARTRQQVINDAASYAAYSWTVGASNLLDTKTYIENGTAVPDISTNTPDGVDDRAQQYTDRYGNVHYSVAGNPAWWPFFDGDTVDGEAYAWGGWNDVAKWGADTTSTFTTRRLSSLKWIAGGRAGVDIPYSGKTTMPLGYRGYTGIDCSGFVGNVLDISRFASDSYKLNTSTLTNYAVSVTVAELKPGDMLNNPGDHVALFAGWINKPYTAKIIHASYKNFFRNKYEYHVSTDIATVTGNDVGNTLLARTADNYYPFSFFPQFRWSAPVVCSV